MPKIKHHVVVKQVEKTSSINVDSRRDATTFRDESPAHYYFFTPGEFADFRVDNSAEQFIDITHPTDAPGHRYYYTTATAKHTPLSIQRENNKPLRPFDYYPADADQQQLVLNYLSALPQFKDNTDDAIIFHKENITKSPWGYNTYYRHWYYARLTNHELETAITNLEAQGILTPAPKHGDLNVYKFTYHNALGLDGDNNEQKTFEQMFHQGGHLFKVKERGDHVRTEGLNQEQRQEPIEVQQVSKFDQFKYVNWQRDVGAPLRALLGPAKILHKIIESLYDKLKEYRRKTRSNTKSFFAGVVQYGLLGLPLLINKVLSEPLDYICAGLAAIPALVSYPWRAQLKDFWRRQSYVKYYQTARPPVSESFIPRTAAWIVSKALWPFTKSINILKHLRPRTSDDYRLRPNKWRESNHALRAVYNFVVHPIKYSIIGALSLVRFALAIPLTIIGFAIASVASLFRLKQKTTPDAPVMSDSIAVIKVGGRRTPSVGLENVNKKVTHVDRSATASDSYDSYNSYSSREKPSVL